MRWPLLPLAVLALLQSLRVPIVMLDQPHYRAGFIPSGDRPTLGKELRR